MFLCGEVYVQKTVFFLQKLMEVPLSYNFVLHMFGFFSFDMRDNLSKYVACELIYVDIVPDRYPFSLYLRMTFTNRSEEFPLLSKN